METHSFLTSYWLQEAATFKKNLAILRKGHDTEALHDIRVSIKKLRASIEFYIQLTGEPLWEDPLSETEKLFQTGGRERDTEMCVILLKKHRGEDHQAFSGLLHHLQQVLQQTRGWSAAAFRQYDAKEIERFGSLLKTEDGMLQSPTLSDKAISLVREGILQAQPLYRKPHRLRQHLKKVFYWLKALPPGTPVAIGEKPLHDALDELGAWQDNIILVTRIKHFRKDVLPAPDPEKTESGKLEEALKEENRDSLRKALRLIRSVHKKTAETVQ